MADIKDLLELVRTFRDERSWKQFHTVKDMHLSLSIEVAELGEHFQWKGEEEILSSLDEKRESIGHELADCFYWLLLLSHDLGIDLEQSLRDKLQQNAAKYPIAEAFGRKEKYTELPSSKDRK